MAKKRGKAAQRRAREAAARAAVARARKRRQWTITIISIAVVVILAGVTTAIVLVTRGGGQQVAGSGGGALIWPVPSDPTAQVKKAGLTMLSAEGTVLHIHAHLDVYTNGDKVKVPAEIGIDEQAQTISPLHTHDTTGVIHIESPTKRTFTLGQFFTEWDVTLSASQVGDLKTGGGKQLHAYVNGKEQSGDPASIVLHAHDEIAVVYGTAAQQKNPPSTYKFASGL